MVVVHDFNPITLEAEAGSTEQAPGQPVLRRRNPVSEQTNKENWVAQCVRRCPTDLLIPIQSQEVRSGSETQQFQDALLADAATADVEAHSVQLDWRWCLSVFRCCGHLDGA